MRDCRLLKGSITAPVLQLVYAAACSKPRAGRGRSRGGSKGRMGFDNFLDALVDVAARVYPRIANPKAAAAALSELVVSYDGGLSRPTAAEEEAAAAAASGGLVVLDNDPAAGSVRAFVVLLTSHVLSLAAHWPVERWRRAGDALRSPAVLRVFARFAPSLYEMFRFYAPPVLHSNRSPFCSTKRAAPALRTRHHQRRASVV